MEIEAQLLEIYQDAKLYKKPELLNRRGGHLYSEAAVALIDSLYNDLKDMHTVNTRNSGVLPYLDAEEVAEIACVVDRNGPHPVEVKKQGTPHMIQMIQTVKAYERMAVEAAVHGDQSLALAALMSHPLIGDFSKAKACFEEMLEAHICPNFSIDLFCVIFGRHAVYESVHVNKYYFPSPKWRNTAFGASLCATVRGSWIPGAGYQLL